jgi:hypothetical protein
VPLGGVAVPRVQGHQHLLLQADLQRPQLTKKTDQN